MIDGLFGPSTSQLVAMMREEQEHRVALYLVLLEKEVITEAEYQGALVRAKHALEQLAAQRAEETKDSPQAKTEEFFRKLVGDDNADMFIGK
jgi:hypothetical protein